VQDKHNALQLQAVNTICLEGGLTWLPVGIRAWEGSVGPTVIPRQTACIQCYDLRRKANLDDYEATELYEEHLKVHGHSTEFGSVPFFAHTIAALAASEALKLLTHFRPPTTLGRVLNIDLLSSLTQVRDVLKLPRCPACGEPAQQMPMIKPWSDS